ncbi:hypothetical protein [Streptomyces sp. NPDC006879]|uniref:hypothetical protein n=1 Tax=Streptomyces sp. NPDC006879 TaxID=3364767 RepID=UPI0036C2938B
MIIEMAKDALPRMLSASTRASLIGTFAVEVIAAEQAKEADSTYLLIRRKNKGKTSVSVFRFPTRRKLRISMNGEFVQEVEHNRITITVAPDTNSRISVVDAHTGDRLHREGSFRLFGWGAKEAYDLDTGKSGDADSDSTTFKKGHDLRVASLTETFGKGLGIRMANGASAAIVKNSKQATYDGCASLPADKWSGRMFNSDPLEVHPTFCVRTSDGRYGRVRMKLDLSYHYVLWEVPAST